MRRHYTLGRFLALACACALLAAAVLLMLSDPVAQSPTSTSTPRSAP